MATASDLENMDLCPSTVSAERIHMDVPDSTLRVGSTVQVTAFPVDLWCAYELCAPGIQFATGDPGVAGVSSAGLVTGVGAGTAYIRASSGTVRDSVAIKVVAAAVASIAMR
jgi:Big-like domain-containing protein